MESVNLYLSKIDYRGQNKQKNRYIKILIIFYYIQLYYYTIIYKYIY